MKLVSRAFFTGTGHIACELKEFSIEKEGPHGLKTLLDGILSCDGFKIGYSKSKDKYGPFDISENLAEHYLLYQGSLDLLLQHIYSRIPKSYLLDSKQISISPLTKVQMILSATVFDTSNYYLFDQSYSDKSMLNDSANTFDYFFSALIVSDKLAYLLTVWYD